MSSFFGDDDDSDLQSEMEAQNKKQADLLKQQQTEQAQEDQRVERERIQALRGRFGGTDMGDDLPPAPANNNNSWPHVSPEDPWFSGGFIPKNAFNDVIDKAESLYDILTKGGI